MEIVLTICVQPKQKCRTFDPLLSLKIVYKLLREARRRSQSVLQLPILTTDLPPVSLGKGLMPLEICRLCSIIIELNARFNRTSLLHFRLVLRFHHYKKFLSLDDSFHASPIITCPSTARVLEIGHRHCTPSSLPYLFAIESPDRTTVRDVFYIPTHVQIDIRDPRAIASVPNRNFIVLYSCMPVERRDRPMVRKRRKRNTWRRGTDRGRKSRKRGPLHISASHANREQKPAEGIVKERRPFT